MTYTDWMIILPCGMVVSALGTLVGLGGGVFIIPLLVMGFDVPLKTAIPAVTFCLFPSAVLSSLFNYRRKLIDYGAAISLEVPALIGAVAGATLASLLPVAPLEIMFSGFIAYMGRRILRKAPEGDTGIWHRINRIPPVVKRQRGELVYLTGVPALGLFGMFSGLIAGLFGVGGGIIKTPVMLRIFRMPPRMASATAIFMIMFTSAIASVSHWRLGTMSWELALPLSTSFLAGSLVANSFGGKLRSELLEKLLGATLIAASAAIMAHVIWF
jgi:uncharacterized membrane protein YfcA